MKKISIYEHLLEIRLRLKKILYIYVVFFLICYLCKQRIYSFLLSPLSSSLELSLGKIIYTGLAEAFFSYLKIASFASFMLLIPIINWHIYGFVSPGLFASERRIFTIVLVFSPILFYLGSAFLFFFVMPKAWSFFLSFENFEYEVPLVLHARISEYVSLVLQLLCAFGITFQLPVILLIMYFLGFLDSIFLIKFRKIFIVVSFIIAAILTPPDVLSQFCLALPLIALYELSIIILKYLEYRKLGYRC